MTEKPIIPPVDRDLIKSELTEKSLVRKTRKGDNEIHIINHHNSPNVMREIGRLREIAFRESGGGTGEEIDVDEMDTGKNCYEQLLVWSPKDEEIIGGYRYIYCPNAGEEHGEPALSTAHYFTFSEKFEKEFLPRTIELGRSWVQPKYQPSVNPRKGLYALDNIWDGLGSLVNLIPDAEYYFGKVTMYPDYNTEARDFLLYFMRKYFPDPDSLIASKYPIKQTYDPKVFSALLDGLSYKEAYRVMKNFVRARGENIPPLINIYMSVSPNMRTFETAVNPDFGGVEETGILIRIPDISDSFRERYIR